MAKRKDLVTRIVESLEEKKGNDIVVLDLTKIDNTIADYFVIADTTSNTHSKALSDFVQKQVSKDLKTKPLGVEGEELAEWILLDYGEVIVHIFQRPVREYYDLESLWGDARSMYFEETNKLKENEQG